MKLTRRCCAECGVDYEARPDQRFCDKPCRVKFMNRRNQRGAQLYDIIMSGRYDRKTENEARRLMQNLARAARDADKRLREGRPSWLPFEETKANMPLAYGRAGDNR